MCLSIASVLNSFLGVDRKLRQPQGSFFLKSLRINFENGVISLSPYTDLQRRKGHYSM